MVCGFQDRKTRYRGSVLWEERRKVWFCGDDTKEYEGIEIS